MNNKTYAPNSKNLPVNWSFIDASDKVLGMVAVNVAKKLMGKHRAYIAPNIVAGDRVVVTNASKIAVTGNKLIKKVYRWHTGYPKGLRALTLEKMLAKSPEKVLRLAVEGMLPKNKLRKIMMANLYIYEGSEHPHKAQESK